MPNTVLLVDDDEAVLNVFQMLLAKRNYLVDRARSMEEMQARLAQTEYDVVVADLNLGHAADEGVAVLSYLVKLPRRPVMVVWSGYTSLDVEERVLGLGADLFLPKPVVFRTLLEKLEELLARAGQVPVGALEQPGCEGLSGMDGRGGGCVRGRE